MGSLSHGTPLSEQGGCRHTRPNKEFQMAASGPGESRAHRRRPAVRTLMLLSVVIAIVLVVVLL
jgi:hypothetical protein